MRNGTKKIIIIAIIVTVVIAIIGTVLAYLIMATDTFKSEKELFGKYIVQNTEMFDGLMNSNANIVTSNFKIDKSYQNETNITFSHSEGGEVSNPINDLAIKILDQKDRENQYSYADAQILFKDEEYLELEAIRDKEIYGIRFSDLVKEFISIRDGGNIPEVATDLGIETDDLIKVFEIISGTRTISEEILSKEEMYSLREKYSNIIKEEITNGTFSKIKKSVITVNGNTVETNAYIVNLSSEQVQKIVLEILETVKSDTLILDKLKYVLDENTFIESIDKIIDDVSASVNMPTAKIAVHEQKGITVKTIIEIGMQKIAIENIKEQGKNTVSIQSSKIDSEEPQEQKIQITKEQSQNQEIYNITIDLVEGEETTQINISRNSQYNDSSILTNTTIGYTQDISTTSVMIEDNLNLINTIEEKQQLDEKSNIILNDLEEEGRRNIIDILKRNVPTRIKGRIELLKQALGIKDEINPEEQTPNAEPTQVDINRFNAKFEFYTGEEVSAENVKTLLDIVKSNINSVEITPIQNEESGNGGSNNQEEVKENIKLNIEKDKENVELINSILEKIDDKKKYKVSISYNNANGLIDYITIVEVGK